jgi:hypothetical protein
MPGDNGVDKIVAEVVEGLDPENMTHEQKVALWEQRILERAKDKCSNCGSTHKVRVKPIVPIEAGGQLSMDNGTTLCRACEMAADVISSSPSGSAQRPVNFWVSRRLYDKVKALNGFKSTGSLIRFLMSKYVRDSSRFDDLAQWQEDGSDLKINVWVDQEVYGVFKGMVNKDGLTVTDALKALIRMYEEEAEPLVRGKDNHG